MASFWVLLRPLASNFMRPEFRAARMNRCDMRCSAAGSGARISLPGVCQLAHLFTKRAEPSGGGAFGFREQAGRERTPKAAARRMTIRGLFVHHREETLGHMGAQRSFAPRTKSFTIGLSASIRD